MQTYRFDLGSKALLSEWLALFKFKHLKEDIFAGLSVAFIAIPLSLAIALASEVEPANGIYTAIVAGFVCALFGGTKLAVSGPAASIAVVVAANVEQYGMAGLMIIGCICGFLQIITGILGLGRFSQYIPKPVVSGFTAGIGCIILVGQLPRLLGVAPPDQAHVIDVLIHITQYLHETNMTVLLVGLLSIVLMRTLPWISSKLPAPLIAVVIPTAVVWWGGLTVPMVGRVPQFLPIFQFPDFVLETWTSLLMSAFAVYFLASLQTLVSTSAADQMVKEPTQSDPNQELIGQGLGNIAVSLIGGIPIAGLIARTALNVQAGAKTRRAAVFHSLFLLLSIVYLPDLIARIPLSALAGVLLSVAATMINVKEFKTLTRISKHEALIYIITFVMIVLVDLAAGIQAGIGAAALILVVKLSQTEIKISKTGEQGPSRLTLRGSLNFLSSMQLESITRSFSNAKPGQPIVIDMADISQIDSSAATMLIDFVARMETKSVMVILKGLKPEVNAVLRTCNSKNVKLNIAVTEDDVLNKVGLDLQASVKYRLQHGAELFRNEGQELEQKRLFHKLARGQKPHTLLITCADSRINPNLITSTDPGELFVIRNIGNVIPDHSSETAMSVGAAIEYAVTYLNIQTIIVCGHSSCGAVQATLRGSEEIKDNHLRTWLGEVSVPLITYPPPLLDDEFVNVAAKYNVAIQVERLRTYPQVRAKLEDGTLSILGWFYDLKHSHIYEWDVKGGTFHSIT